MLYLIFRIAVFLVAAASLGFGIGWYVRQVSSAKREADIQKQLNATRSRVPQLEASLKSRETDCERLRQELAESENKFASAGALIDKRDHELVEHERKITRLNNSLDILKATPEHYDGSDQTFIVPEDFAGKEAELDEQKNLLSQLEVRLEVQDQLIREAEARAEAKTTALALLESNHSRQIDTLEEMLAEAQIQVANFVSSQNETKENIQRLTDEISELSSAESQHESEVTSLEEELEQDRQARVVLEESLEHARQEGLNLEQNLEQGRQTRVTLEQDLEQSRQVQFFLEQDLGSAHEAGQQLAELEHDLIKQQSVLDSQSELSSQALVAVQAKLTGQNKRNASLEEQLTRSRQAQLKLAAGYNEGMAARKKLETLHDQGASIATLESERTLQQKSLEILSQQLEDARETEVRLVQRHRELEQTIENLEAASIANPGLKANPGPNPGVEPAVLYEQLPAHVDNLKAIKGLGVAAEKQLNSLGIYHFQQIAEFDAGNVDWVEQQLKKLKGRFKRDDWISQATHMLNSAPRIQNSESAIH